MNKKTIKNIFLSLSLLIFQSFCWGSEEHIIEGSQSFPFKVGLELEEINQACHWAKDLPRIQKKELFSFGREVEENFFIKLWHVVIDGANIEFVFPPFKHSELELLKEALHTMMDAARYITIKDLAKEFNEEELKERLAGKKILIGKGKFEEKIASDLKKTRYPMPELSNPWFNLWVEWLKTHQNYREEPEENLVSLWNNSSGNLPILDNLFRGDLPPLLFSAWIDKIRNESPNYIIKLTDSYEEVINKEIKLINLEFQPQVTLQYPLEYTLPLLFGLYNYEFSPITRKLIESLPHLGMLQNHSPFTDYLSKENGLIFLHALTLSSMIFQKDTPTLISEIYEDYKRGQIDAKRRLDFMSRRPFSAMFQDIISHRDINLEKLYIDIMRQNPFFSELFLQNDAVWCSTGHLNHGEEFFQEERPFDLSWIKENFTQDFKDVLEKNYFLSEATNSLLRNGVFITEMVKYLNHETMPLRLINTTIVRPTLILEEFYEKAIRTIQCPFSQYIFNVEERCLEEVLTNYDTLSPPFPLHPYNSMGFMKDEEEIDKRFGEAIVEVRNIKFAFPRQKEKILFLTNQYHDQGKSFEEKKNILIKDMEILWYFLERFPSIEQLQGEFKNAIINLVNLIPDDKEK